ncbi:trypsin, alkaline B-like [Bombyx mandarina]|uniref:Trypsin, alkaline B-like n=1 Tax=Bombyx mandarina TaxID=7092 RepID=A0A6J2JK12_BOMMA|nr:trypsin, alkaline B-like [Bombyx mandarina]
MRQSIAFVFLVLGWANAVPTNQDRITGGSVVTIDRYPELAATLVTSDGVQWFQGCGSSILNNRAVLTAAHCLFGVMRVRVGSSFGNSGGTVHHVSRYITHPNYVAVTFESDLAILHVSTQIIYVNNAVRPARIAGPNYNVADNQVVWATGWGSMWLGSGRSEQLRHVQLYTVSQDLCRARYTTVPITANMLCVGRLGVDGFGQCGGDSGSPLFHNGVVVGVCSFGVGCGHDYFPTVNVRVSRFTSWIQNNA